jgi:hypothetical protein
MANVEVELGVKAGREPSRGDLPSYVVQLESEWKSLSKLHQAGEVVISEVEVRCRTTTELILNNSTIVSARQYPDLVPACCLPYPVPPHSRLRSFIGFARICGD